MTFVTLLIHLRACRAAVISDGNTVRITATVGARTTELSHAVQEHKDALKELPRPFVTPSGDLIIPWNAAPQYHWQPLSVTMLEAGVSEQIWRKYSTAPYSEATE
jgi:hypothetical protein